MQKLFAALYAFLIAGIVIAILFPIFVRPHGRPPFDVQRREQRQEVQQRLMQIGGYAGLRQACNALCASHPKGLYWYRTRFSSSTLPNALKPLRPMYIAIREPNTLSGARVVRIQMFGGHTTGMRGIAHYELWVECGSNTPDEKPALEETHSGGEYSGRSARLADHVYEVY